MSESEIQKIFRPISQREKYNLFNTLAGIVKALEGKYTIIDLRNECCVTGKIIKVDGRMNVEMEDAVYYDSRGNDHIFPSFFLSERNIRYVHIPKNTSATKLIERQVNRMTPHHPVKESRTFKTIRAKRYNREITSEILSGQLAKNDEK